MVNIRPSELADSTVIGKLPYGMTTRTAFAGMALRGQIQKLMPAWWYKPFDHLDLELPLDDAIEWCRLKDEADLRRRLARLSKPFGMQPKYPGETRSRMRPAVLLDYEVRRGKLWYHVGRYYLMLPKQDRLYLKLDTFYDAVGDRRRFREIMRAAADLSTAKKGRP